MAEEGAPPSGEPAASGAESTSSKVTYSARGIAFEVPTDWAQAEGTDLFYTGKNEVYGLNGASPLGSYEPQAFFEELATYYSGQFDTFDAPEALTAWQAADGVECLAADLTGVYEVYRGQAAMDQVASMTEYGLTMEELERVLSASMNGYIPGGSKPSDYFYAMGELKQKALHLALQVK